MMRAAITALCLLAAPAHAAVFGTANTITGRIDLHNTAGAVCVGDALAATYRPANPDATTVSGCWTAGGDVVFVVFFDGDIARIPMAAVRKPVSV